MRRRRHADPVECYSAAAFWQWVKLGRSYDEATLIQVLEEACWSLPDVLAETSNGQLPQSDKIGVVLARSARSISAASPPKCLTKATPPVRVRGIADLRDDPDSFRRQRNALLMLCRARREVVGVDEALDFLRHHQLYTGDWHDGGRRTTRVRQILSYIAKTFNKDLCRYQPLALNLKKYRQWATCCRGWRGRDRVAMDEYGRISRGRCRTVVGPRFLAVFMSITEYCLITDKNDDDTFPPGTS